MTAEILTSLRERIQESRRAAVAQFREHERPDTLLGDLRRICLLYTSDAADE